MQKPFIISVSLCIIGFFCPCVIVYAQDQVTQQQQHLDQQTNKNTDFQYGILQQGLALIGAGGAAGATAFFAWQRERRIPPAAEQEKIIENLLKQWHSRSYLLVLRHVCFLVQQSRKDDEHLVDYYWELLSHRELDIDKFGESKSQRAASLEKHKQYFKKKLRLNEKEIDTRMEAIRNNAEAEYYDKVRILNKYVLYFNITWTYSRLFSYLVITLVLIIV